MKKRRKNNDNQRMFLAREVAELIVNRYPRLSLLDVKNALMSAEQFVIDTMYCKRGNEHK
ncbi:MAG: hypothetical protein IEMM0002_0871 [bacterium]|nr:MAG: hypothetical protein IEMM0002_0871 [bacterium]